MDDATQKLVDEAREVDADLWHDGSPAENHKAHATIVGLITALEAAQRRAEEDHAEANRLVNEYAVKAGNLALALEAAQRPAVSPEVRELLVAALVDVPLTTQRRYDGESVTHVYGRRELASLEADALLARFSFPSQSVYDEKKIAELLVRVSREGNGEYGAYVDEVEGHFLAAALVAALRRGELTKEARTPTPDVEFVRDLAEHGVRFDLNPTVDGRQGAGAYVEYIGRIDRSIRERAAAALPGLTKEENRG